MVDDLAHCPTCGRPVCPTCSPSASTKIWTAFGRIAFLVMILFAVSFVILSFLLIYGGKKLEPASTSATSPISPASGDRVEIVTTSGDSH